MTYLSSTLSSIKYLSTFSFSSQLSLEFETKELLRQADIGTGRVLLGLTNAVSSGIHIRDPNPYPLQSICNLIIVLHRVLFQLMGCWILTIYGIFMDWTENDMTSLPIIWALFNPHSSQATNHANQS